MLFIKKHNELKLLFWLMAPIVACGFARYSHAQAPIIWEAPAASQNTNDIRLTDSPFLFAFNGGGSVNISGIEFTGGTFDDLPSGMTFSPSSATADTAAAGLTESTGDSGYDTLLNSMAYTTSGERTGSIEFSGLTTGQEYQIQLWFSDQRGNNRTMSFGDNGASAGGVNLAGGTVDFGQNVVGTFTAAGATQSLSLETNGFNNIHVNALTLAEVPASHNPISNPSKDRIGISIRWMSGASLLIATTVTIWSQTALRYHPPIIVSSKVVFSHSRPNKPSKTC